MTTTSITSMTAQVDGVKSPASWNGKLNGKMNGATETVNEWSEPGSAAFDFRSMPPPNAAVFFAGQRALLISESCATGDTVTRPTKRMLAAIAATTLQDDDFREDPTTLGLEEWIAELTGKESALFVISGTMGNQLCVRAHLKSPPNSVLCDARSHLVTHEAGGVASLSGAMVNCVSPANGLYLTQADVEAHFNRGTLITDCPTRLIVLEIPLGGVIMPLAECRRISEWARAQGIALHLDGARLWEAVAAGAGSLRDYCSCFDSISLCFSKGLGAPIGSVLVGSKALTEQARWIRKSIGGGMRQAGVVCAAARAAVEDTFMGGQLQRAHNRARDIATFWESHGGRLVYPVETNMVWLDLKSVAWSPERLIERGAELGLRFMGARIVVHYQISNEAISRLQSLMREILST
ncbi:Low-specificity L-threonine aldolase [Penicillium brasilianum]|uniref:Low-specificity L-threonine aldolase n=1 Tax=Penicillium brasilianum TaxID=104259 RepID=A0A1S9RPI3_PENBI|nr:Low-specificity L-threonine aldolase [Penicillium brasilianum]